MQFILSNTVFILLKHFLFLNCQFFSLANVCCQKHTYVELGNLILWIIQVEMWSSSVQFNSATQSCPPLCDFMDLQHARLPCPSPTPRACSHSCPSSLGCHPTISSSVVHFSSCLHSVPASGSFPMCQFFTSGGQSIGVSASASVPPMNIQDWFSLGLTGLISLQSKGLSRVFSSTTIPQI